MNWQASTSNEADCGIEMSHSIELLVGKHNRSVQDQFRRRYYRLDVRQQPCKNAISPHYRPLLMTDGVAAVDVSCRIPNGEKVSSSSLTV